MILSFWKERAISLLIEQVTFQLVQRVPPMETRTAGTLENPPHSSLQGKEMDVSLGIGRKMGET